MPQQFTSDSPTWDEIKSARQPRTDSVWVPLNGEILDQIAALEKVVVAAERADEREHRTPEAPKLRAKLDELREQAEAAAVEFRFVELRRKQFRALVDACPPTEKGWRWDEETFAPLLLAASCESPVLTAGERGEFLRRLVPGVKADDLRDLAAPAFELWDDWSDAACYMLYGVAHSVNAEAGSVPFSVTATAQTRGSRRNSTSVTATDGS